MLIEHGADLNALDRLDNTALIVAIRSGIYNTNIGKSLLKRSFE